MWTDATQAIKRWQWEPSAGSHYESQANNCGPTCVCFIAGFMTDTIPGIEDTRRVVMQCCVPTNGSQQAAMMAARGVPATPIWIDTLGQLKDIVGWDGRRPIIIGVYMARVPATFRDHSFYGWHAIVVMKRAERNGVLGFLVMDPNFSPPGGYRPDPDRGLKFYPDWVIDYAFLRNSPRWSVSPNKPKEVERPNNRIAGDPAGMGKTFVNQLGDRITIKAGKPIRNGFTVKDRVLRTTNRRITRGILGRIRVRDLPQSERPFGAVYVLPLEVRNGVSKLGYVKEVDTL